MDENVRRWPQFSLRWIFIQMTLIALLLGLYTVAFHSDPTAIRFGMMAVAFGINGAIVGGLFRHFRLGALIGAFSFATWFVWTALVLEALSNP